MMDTNGKDIWLGELDAREVFPLSTEFWEVVKTSEKKFGDRNVAAVSRDHGEHNPLGAALLTVLGAGIGCRASGRLPHPCRGTVAGSSLGEGRQGCSKGGER